MSSAQQSGRGRTNLYVLRSPILLVLHRLALDTRPRCRYSTVPLVAAILSLIIKQPQQLQEQIIQFTIDLVSINTCSNNKIKMSNVRGLFDGKKDDDSDDDSKQNNNRFVGGIDSRGGGRLVKLVAVIAIDCSLHIHFL